MPRPDLIYDEKLMANRINSPSVLASQEPWEYHYPTAFGIQYVELTQLVRLRDCILGSRRQMVTY